MFVVRFSTFVFAIISILVIMFISTFYLKSYHLYFVQCPIYQGVAICQRMQNKLDIYKSTYSNNSNKKHSIHVVKGGEYNYHDDMLVINSAHVLPTGVGLPLELAFNGSVSIDLKVEGQLDMSGLFGASPTVAFKADLNPR